MCRFDTILRAGLTTLGLLCLATTTLAQTYEFALSWRPIGTTVVYNSRAGFSGAPVAGVWFTSDGASLEIQLQSGKFFRTEDFDNWLPISRAGTRATQSTKVVDSLPELGARVVAAPGNSYRAYAAGQWVWRSDDSGKHWSNIVADAQTWLIGKNVREIAVSPRDPDHLAVITDEGLWLSADGGSAWASLNAGLPNIQLPRLLAAPLGGRGLLAEWQNGEIVEWTPGAKAAWVARGVSAPRRDGLRWVDTTSPELQLEVRKSDRIRLHRTLNGGSKWDDLTSDLPALEIYGLAADRPSGAIYVATERGVFYTLNSLETAAAPTSWIRLGGNLPREAAFDVLLDERGNFLYVSVAGDGVFLTYAPHRRRNPSLISAADLNSRSVAPGSLMSVVGMKLTQAQLAGRLLPVLSATPDETQIQIPYDALIPSPSLEVRTDTGTQRLDLELAETAPVIFTDRDGAPLLLDAETGELLDPSVPLKSGLRFQILLAGLGRVSPDWPAGVAAPALNTPKVAAAVSVWFNDQTLEVTKAELAGGYIGFYAVETKMPPILDEGLATLRVEAGGRSSNSIQVRTSLN